jgi:hypothetical protein
MVLLKVTFYVPPSTFPPEILYRSQNLAKQIIGNIQSLVPDTKIMMEPTGHIDLKKDRADGDVRVEFILAGPDDVGLAIKKVIQSLGRHWLNCGVSLEMPEPCPDCGNGTLIRVNKGHECCDHCEQNFENRTTETVEGGA